MPVISQKSPGKLLEEKIKERGLTQQDAADMIGISRQYLNAVINGKYPFTADLSLKVAEPLGTVPEFWSESLRSHEEFTRSPVGRDIQQANEREALLLDFELQSARTLVDHQIQGALAARCLRIEPELGHEQLLATSCVLSFGLKAYFLGAGGTPTASATKPFALLRRGESLSLSTHEKITMTPRFRARVLGLCDALAEKCLHLSCISTLDGGFSNHLTFVLTNLGPFEIKITHGEPCLVIGFEFLPQAPVRGS